MNTDQTRVGNELVEDLVSVIITTFNRSQLVQQAIDSARSQTYAHVEIIVVDDGSTDETVEKLREMTDIKLIAQNHAGMTPARNAGLKQAEGQFVACLDSDDIWEPSFLENSVNALKSFNSEFVFSNWYTSGVNELAGENYFEKHQNRWWNFLSIAHDEWRVVPSVKARSMLLDLCPCPTSGIVFRNRRVPSGWTDGFKIADDWCLLLDLLYAHDCAIAFTLRKSWTKRVVGDNVADGRAATEIERLLWYEDYQLIYQRFQHLMPFSDRAKMSRRIAQARVRMTAIEWREGRKMAAGVSLLKSFCAIVAALYFAPYATSTKLLSRVMPFSSVHSGVC